MPSEQEQKRLEQIDKILDFCNRTKIRVTYGAVAGIIEVIPRAVGHKYLGNPCERTSWVVRKDSKKPSGYPEKLYHNDLLKNSYVIEDAEELMDAL